MIRTPVRDKAKQFSKLLKKEQPDYNYLREVFRHIRKEMDIKIDSGHTAKKLPYVPTEEEIDKYYQAVWKSRNMKYVINNHIYPNFVFFTFRIIFF